MKKRFFGEIESPLAKADRPANYKNAEDLEREASALSNFSGGGGSAYIGLDDEFLQFAGDTGSFADPIHQGKLYTVTLTNASSTNTRYALLSPGLLFTQAVGLMVTGAFNDTTGGAGLSAVGNPNAIEYFNYFIRHFPTLCAAFKVSTSNIQQFEQNLVIQKQSPFKIYDTRNINVAAYASEANPNTTLISVEQSFYIDCQTQIMYGVLPSTAVSIGLFFGPSLNIAHALYEKTERAAGNLARMGAGTQANNGVMSFRGRSRY